MEIAQQHQQNDEESNRNVENISVKVGQHASLPCYVSNLGAFKVFTHLESSFPTQLLDHRM